MVFWVFGYGSLVWNPGFEYDEKVIGFIKDYRRVFDLGTFLMSIHQFNLCSFFFFFFWIFMVAVLLHTSKSSIFIDIFCMPACIDHRGTPDRPARTCTLENIEGAVCVSRSYEK